MTQVRAKDQLVVILRLIECRPPTSRLVFTLGGKELRSADNTGVHSVVFQFQVLSWEWSVSWLEISLELIIKLRCIFNCQNMQMRFLLLSHLSVAASCVTRYWMGVSLFFNSSLSTLMVGDLDLPKGDQKDFFPIFFLFSSMMDLLLICNHFGVLSDL